MQLGGRQRRLLPLAMAVHKAVALSPMGTTICMVGGVGSICRGKENLLEVSEEAPHGVLPLLNIWTDNSSSQKDAWSRGGLLGWTGASSGVRGQAGHAAPVPCRSGGGG